MYPFNPFKMTIYLSSLYVREEMSRAIDVRAHEKNQGKSAQKLPKSWYFFNLKS